MSDASRGPAQLAACKVQEQPQPADRLPADQTRQPLGSVALDLSRFPCNGVSNGVFNEDGTINKRKAFEKMWAHGLPQYFLGVAGGPTYFGMSLQSFLMHSLVCSV